MTIPENIKNRLLVLMNTLPNLEDYELIADTIDMLDLYESERKMYNSELSKMQSAHASEKAYLADVARNGNY